MNNKCYFVKNKKNKMKLELKMFYFALLVMICLSSCTVETNTHFKKDYSGSMQTNVDFAGSRSFFKTMLGDEGEKMIDSMVVMLKKQNSGKSHESINQIKKQFAKKGVHKFNIEVPTDNQISFSFDFDNIEAITEMSLDKALTDNVGLAKSEVEGRGQLNTKDLITVDGKWMTIDFSADGIKEFAQEMEGGKTGMYEQLQQIIGDKVVMKQSYSFDRKIKKVITPFDYQLENKKITIKYTTIDILDMLKKEEKPILKIKLK